MPWLDKYKRRLSPLPAKCEAISESNYRFGLGDISRYRDWQTFFQNELKQKPWKELLNTWVDRLAPGYIAAAMHGVIRTGHAVRSLTKNGSADIVNELANGLAYWAARYQPLAETESRPPVVFGSIYDALHKVNLLPGVQRGELGLITKEVATVETMAQFPQVINLLDQSDQPDITLSHLTEGFAFMFICNAEPSGKVIALVHALTGPYALRHMIPILDNGVAKKALKYAWQASAALFARYGVGLQPGGAETVPIYAEAELIERAVATHDEHAVKFIEACIAEHKINPNPIYLSAATVCCGLLP